VRSWHGSREERCAHVSVISNDAEFYAVENNPGTGAAAERIRALVDELIRAVSSLRRLGTGTPRLVAYYR